MNERVVELIKQSGTDVSGKWMSMYQVEKFAQLIVRECLAHGKLTQSQAVVNGSDEYNAGREMGIEVFMNQIKEHFGVEE